MRRATKRIISAIAIILVVAIIVTTVHMNRITAEAEGYVTLPGIESILMNNSDSNPFVIVEVVANKADASFGYLVKGEEPIKEGKTLHDMPSETERKMAMDALSTQIANGTESAILKNLLNSGALSYLGGYEETALYSGADTSEVYGEFVKNDAGDYEQRIPLNAYRPYVAGDTSGERYSRYLDVDFEGDDTVLTFKYINSPSEKNINYNGIDYHMYYTYSIPADGVKTLNTVSDYAAHAGEQVYYITDSSSILNYVYYGRMQSNGKIKDKDGNEVDPAGIILDKYAFVTFEKTTLSGDYVYTNVSDVSGNNGGFGLYEHYEVNRTSGEYVKYEDDVYDYLPAFPDYESTKDLSAYTYKGPFSFVGNRKYYYSSFSFNNGINNNDWFKEFVLDLTDAQKSSHPVQVISVTMDEFNASDYVSGASMVYLAAGTYTKDIDSTRAQKLVSEVKNRSLPVVMDSSFGSGLTNNAKLATLLKQKQLSDTNVDSVLSTEGEWNNTTRWTQLNSKVDTRNSFVNSNIFIYDDANGTKPLVYGDFITAIDATTVQNNFNAVKEEIDIENTYRKIGKGQGVDYVLKDKHAEVSKATILRYIINFAHKRVTTKSTLNVLEIEPCYSFDYYDKGTGENSLNSITVKNSNRTVTTLSRETLDKDIISGWLNQENEASNINLTQTYTKEFIGKIEDLNEKYDLIYIGLDTTTMNTAISGSTKTNTTLYNDDSMKGIIYSHLGDEVQGYNDVLKWSSGYDTSVVNNRKYRLSGNDITYEKYMDLVEYIKAGYAVVFADDFFCYNEENGKLIITAVNSGKVEEAVAYVGENQGDYTLTGSYIDVGAGNGKYSKKVEYKNVGSRKGDYSLEEKYTYVGPGNGEYAPTDYYNTNNDKGGDYSRSGNRWTGYVYKYEGPKGGRYLPSGYEKASGDKATYILETNYVYVGSKNGNYSKEESYYEDPNGQYVFDYDKSTATYAGPGKGNAIKYNKYNPNGTKNGAIGPNSYMYDLASFVINEKDEEGKRYIDKNVFIRSDIESSDKSEVKKNFTTYLNISKLSVDLKMKPTEYSVSNDGIVSPDGYLKSDTLSYCVFLENNGIYAADSTTYDVSLYIDTSTDGRYTANEKLTYISVYKGSVSPSNLEEKDGNGKYNLKAGNTYYIQVRLPNGYVGMLPWKMVFSQNPQGVNDTYSQLIRKAVSGYTAVEKSKTEKETINVLQLIGENERIDATNRKTRLWLNDPNVTNQLGKVNDFDILIDVVDVKDLINKCYYGKDYRGKMGLQQTVPTPTNKSGGTEAWKNVDAKNALDSNKGNSQEDFFKFFDSYDMIIIGFCDVFDFSGGKEPKSGENEEDFIERNINAIKALNQYIQSGKSILFTHDSTSRFNANYDASNNIIKDWGTRPYDYNKSYLWGYYFNTYIRNTVGMDRYNVLGDNPDSMYDYYLTKGDTRKNNWLENGEKNNSKTDLTYGYSDLELFNRYLRDQSSQYQLTCRHDGSLYDGQYNTINDTNPSKIYYATQVNQGQITEYPFKIPSTLRIATTHNQIYQLNLDTYSKDSVIDDDIVVWYCISNVKGDYGSTEMDDIYQMAPNDVRNNYYIYTKGNITYSGAGHSDVETTGTDEKLAELRLFINTMVAAYKAGIHSPSIVYHDADSDAVIDTTYIPYDRTYYDEDTGKYGIYLPDSYDSEGNGEITLYFEITDTNIVQGDRVLQNEFKAINYELQGSEIKGVARNIPAKIYTVDRNNKLSDSPILTITGTEGAPFEGKLDANTRYAIKVKVDDLRFAGADVYPYVEISLRAKTQYIQASNVVESGWGECNLEIRRLELFDLK